MKKLLGFAIIVLLCVTPGFAQKPSSQKQRHNAFTRDPSETQMIREIRHNLLMLPYYTIFDELTFEVNGGVVTLHGACPPDTPWDIKQDAGEAVKSIPGVKQVINEIKVLPLSPMDWQIRRAEAKAIYGDPEIGTRYGYRALPSIHIIVDNGHVTLDGVVDNTLDDTLVRTRANEVPNVFSVTDNLVIRKSSHQN
jgi:hyperosmotically inducible protein